MIDDHAFRKGHISPTSTGEGNNRGQNVVPGMCAYLGTCNRPRSEHARAVQPRAEKRPTP